jgi:V8-like Glu-specific endopeptidase
LLTAADSLDAFSEAADYAVVGPTDNRVQEADTTGFPFNTVCHLGRDFGDGRLRGCSGVLIAPTIVLTAAHCLYSLLLGRAPRRILVHPGRRDRDTLPFGSREAAHAYIPRGFVGARGGVPVRRSTIMVSSRYPLRSAASTALCHSIRQPMQNWRQSSAAG